MILAQRALEGSCVLMLLVISVGFVLLTYQQQIVAQTDAAVRANTYDNSTVKTYNNSTLGLETKFFNNWTQAAQGSVDLLNTATEALTPGSAVHFITYFFPNSTNSTTVGLAVTASQNKTLSEYMDEVGQTISNIGGQEVRQVGNTSLAGRAAEGIEYTLGNVTTPDNATKTMNVSAKLPNDKILSFIYASSESEFETHLPEALFIKNSTKIRSP